MRWIKKGLIFAPDNNFDWMISHASIPIADKVGNDRLRIYFGTRDKQGRSLPAYIEVEPEFAAACTNYYLLMNFRKRHHSFYLNLQGLLKNRN